LSAGMHMSALSSNTPKGPSLQLFLVVKGSFSFEKDPLNVRHLVSLTDLWKFDRMHRRAGGEAAAPKVGEHADAHKNCPLGRCGNRKGAYADSTSSSSDWTYRSRKITAWRKAKAYANRAYLEEKVYDHEKR